MGHKARLSIALALFLAGCRAEEPLEESAPPLTLSFLADVLLPRGAELESVAVGGISAVSYSPQNGRWIALSDAQVSSRFFELDVEFDGTAASVTPRGVVHLRDLEGERFPEDVLDPEGLLETPWGTLFVVTETDARDEPVEEAKLLEFDATGALVREFEVPEKFLVSGWPPAKGLRHNLAFESLTLDPTGSRIFVGAEATLLQDGRVAGLQDAGFCRIAVFDVVGTELAPSAEHVYVLGPFAAEPEFVEQEVSGGLVELVALSKERLLALERIFIREIRGEGRDVTRVRIFDVGLSQATDVSSIPSLSGNGEWRPVTKELLLDLDDILPSLSEEYRRLDNLEAMGLGPLLPGSGRALLLVSDDNFQKSQRTQFLLFRLEGSDR